MNKDRVLSRFKEEYPGKSIFFNNDQNPTEIICEVEPTSDHPKYSLAVAVIDRSAPHFHRKTTEEYKVIQGKLTLHVDDQIHQLKPGDKLTINPGQKHWAEGDETWVECYSTPGWTKEDNILIK